MEASQKRFFDALEGFTSGPIATSLRDFDLDVQSSHQLTKDRCKEGLEESLMQTTTHSTIIPTAGSRYWEQENPNRVKWTVSQRAFHTESAKEDSSMDSEGANSSKLENVIRCAGNSSLLLVVEGCSACPEGTESSVASRWQQSFSTIAPQHKLFVSVEPPPFQPEDPYAGLIHIWPKAPSMVIGETPIVCRFAVFQNSLRLKRVFHSVFLVFYVALLALKIEEEKAHINFYPWNGAVGAVVFVCTVFHIMQLHREMVLLVLRTFDFWLLLFWMTVNFIVVMYSDNYLSYTWNDLSTKVEHICTLIVIAASQLVVFFCDASPNFSRVDKGILFVVNGLLLCAIAFQWWYATYAKSLAFYELMNIGFCKLRLATLGQISSVALAAFYLGFAVRMFWFKLDLALVDFPCRLSSHFSRASVTHRESVRDGDDELIPKSSRSNVEVSPHEERCAILGSEWKRVNSSLEQRCESTSLIKSPAYERRYTEVLNSACGFNAYRKEGDFAHPTSCRWVILRLTASILIAAAETEVVLQAEGIRKSLDTELPEANLYFSTLRPRLVDGGSDAATSPHYHPSHLLLSFSPRSLIRSPTVFRWIYRPWYPACWSFCVVLGLSIQMILNHVKQESIAAHVSVDLFLIVLFAFHLAFGISLDVFLFCLRSAEGLYTIFLGASTILAIYMSYTARVSELVAIVHAVAFALGFLCILSQDAIIFGASRRLKAVLGLCLTAYALVVFFTSPSYMASFEEQTLDVGVTTLHLGTLNIQVNLALAQLWFRIFVRTGLMRTELIGIQVGVRLAYRPAPPCTDALRTVGTRVHSGKLTHDIT